MMFGAKLSTAFLGLAWLPSLLLNAQLPTESAVKHESGQNVQPVFEGWQRNRDGAISLWFGYLNRNYKEEVDVPIGLDNKFNPGDDQGQPAHFYPRRHRFVFKVTVPKDWDKAQRMVWTLTSHGRTDTANGWLQPEWEVDDGVIQMNIGPGGAPPVDPPNQPPTITGDHKQAIVFGEVGSLTVSADDDGIPKPRASRSGFPQGLWVRWILYRGPGEVTFQPQSSQPTYGQPVRMTTKAAFSAPGTYWLRAIASDGLFETPHDVTVTVTPGRKD